MRLQALSMTCLGAALLLGCWDEKSGDIATGGVGVAGSSMGLSEAGGALAGGGAASMGGGGGGAGGAETPMREGAEHFTLLFRDELDALDSERWSIMTHSWSTNLALFGSDSVVFKDGMLNLTLLEAPAGTQDDSGAAKRFLGAEVRSKDTLSAGRVKARIKFAKGSAVVSSLVTIYTPWPADNWNELDYEVLGKDPGKVQSNVMVYTGPPTTPPVAVSVKPTQSPELHALDFDSSADFHEYTLEWTPKGVFFLVDDVVVRASTEHLDLLTLPQNILLTIWASSEASWAGAVDGATTGATATYDWVEVSTYVP